MTDSHWIERIAQLRKEHDARVAELLAANNREVEARRYASAQRDMFAGLLSSIQLMAIAGGNPMKDAPKNTPILAWCDHEAGPWLERGTSGKLTLYAAHAEGASHAPTGFHIIEWGGAFDDRSHEDFHEAAHLPDWWFVAGSEFEVAANPIRWWPLPPKLETAKATLESPK